MSDINMDFSFPAVPASAPSSTSVLAPPFGHPQRPLSFSPQSRPRRHAHRRSAAMSEDLNATDLSVLTAPQLATSSLGPSSSPGSVSLRSNNSGRNSTTSKASSTISSGGNMSTGNYNSSTYAHNGNGGTPAINSGGASSVTFAPLPSPQVPQMPLASESSGMHRNSFDLRDARPRMPFSSSPAPATPLRRLGNVGEPGQLVPASPSSSPSPFPSPREDGGRRKQHSDRSKRRSFVRVFKRSRDFDSTGDDTLTANDAVETFQAPTPPLPPPEAPRTPEISSPILTPRNSGEVLRDLEPEPPSIDLDEALSCSFDHRKPEGILESPFSKASSIIGPVPEEEEESEADSLGSISQLRPGVMLHKANSVHSASSFGRNNSAKSCSRPVNPVPSILSPSPDKQQYHAPSSQRPQVAVAKEPDQVSHLAIADPRSSPAKHTETSRPTKGHARRRSFISRLMGRNH